uniref:Uncharacterized protein n=1 Tax=Fagus sylvatica TaxID=28930 RepID=A0A2N9FDD5_FAGSY
MEHNKEGLAPASPSAQYFNSSALSVSIIAVLESEVPINDENAMSLLKDVFLPINPRFSSIMVENEKGEKQWKKVEIKLEDHIDIPIFPTGLSPTSYDKYLDDYISNMAMDRFPQHKPLWEVHIVKYPTSNAAGNVIFKLHHALGDGYSLMGSLLSCLQRADNPSLPLTFPSHQSSKPKNGREKDDRTPIRSGNEGLEYRPIVISTMIFSLDRIKHIKTKLGATINDVITGIIFLGTRLYMQEINHKSSQAHSTALVLLNTRTMKGYNSVEEMLKPDSDTPWGNRFGFLHVPIPKLKDPKSPNPIEFVQAAQEVIKKKKSSFGVYLNGRLLEIVKKLRGPEVHT